MNLSPAAACCVIREKSDQACRRIPDINPYIVKPPYELEIRKKEGMILPKPTRFDQ